MKVIFSKTFKNLNELKPHFLRDPRLNNTIWGSCLTAALGDLQLLLVPPMSTATEGRGQARSLFVTKGNNQA